MQRNEVIEVLQTIGTLLEIKGESPFKCRAYYQAARQLERLNEDLETLVREGRLGEVPGIGAALQEKITCLMQNGTLPFYENLKQSFPPGLPELLKVPGLGPKKVGFLWREKGIGSIEELKQACQSGQLKGLPGFGDKTIANLMSNIEQMETYGRLFRLDVATELAEAWLEYLREIPEVVRVALAGSLRRGREVVKDIDLLASSRNSAAVMEAFVSFPGVARVLAQGETKSSVILHEGIQTDLRVVPDPQFASALHHFTGSRDHHVAMRQRAQARGLRLSEWGLFPSEAGDESTSLPCPDEAALFRHLGLDEIPPELREAAGELEAAEQGKLPRLVELGQLRGCFHNHTHASDGRDSLEAMADAAASIGLDYLGIADHSVSSVQANGLDERHLLAQIEEIARINASRDDIQLLAGVECDILKDGTLDYRDEVLAQLDYVVASVHSSFQMSREAMTARIIRAMEHPHVTMLGHPTGRILLRRESYQVDIPAILEAAARTRTWIELNASPFRLDLDWRFWRRARELGVGCVINPDAHSTQQLGNLRWGVIAARKGWLDAHAVLNTRSLPRIQQLLKTPKSERDWSAY